MIELPPEAKGYFDEKANSFIAALKPLPIPSKQKPPRGSFAHMPVAFRLTDADIIGRMKHNYIDGLGRFIGFAIREGNINEFLPKEAAEKLDNIADKFASQRDIQEYCSTVYVREHLVDWIQRRRLREPADTSWTDDILKYLKRDICEQKILIPLEGIQIEVPFKLGHVTFQYFTESYINAILGQLPEGSPDLEEFRKKFRKNYQGRVYTEFRCKAEKNFAQKLAFFHSDKALEILKFLNPAALEIRAQCFLGRMGQVTPPQWHAFQVLPGGKVLLSQGVESGRRNEFFVDREFLHTSRHVGTVANKLLCKLQLNDLEKRCIEAISHFAHGVASSSPQDRLLHALVAVESLLLKDPNEPVQSHLGYRVALLSTSRLEDRKKAVKDFQKGYKLRSQFVHHGIKPDDVEAANRVLLLCWCAIYEVMVLTKKFDSKQALLESLEDELLTPQTIDTAERSGER
jgi:hypothetical protein